MLNITEILYKSSWDDFFNQNGSPSFLQSWEWGEFEKKSGYEILRLGIFEKEKLQAISLIIKIKAKRGSFLFIPHGPVFQHSTSNTQYSIKKITSQLLNYLSDIAKKENFSFIRIAPTLLDTSENLKIFSDLGFSKAPIYMHAERLWVLDLNKSEEELLAGMRKTTRYLIKRATRDGVVIEKRSDDKVVNDFNKLYQQTAERENFVPFSKEFIRNEFDSFKKTGNAIFLFGSVPKAFPTPEVGKSSPITSALIIFTKSTVFYHQGASIHTKIPITYALQWEAIKEAKRRGCRYYNFWGILQEGRTPKNWGGLTLFKQGFGGRQIDYLPTQDYIISPKYYITSLYERFLAWRRGV
ncbi:hypothetical protein A2954_04265 [Candidatus Roizmanbacteria bacterium RIFCSPLOWO2_01_FULL_37_12]|uniref:BioF2-like acetyltransferase domain-containing protein n=1 Tax=Candidatus Roizmanbacteria bacterium RIFCSPLOWO2_01_FULL_37_12 TaxID=1802056 RepID=A0A1F7IFQ7_9BACT|nr:MAG: hypothetical protein A3D76_06175 [Candidatus Roizmanbacteria bacterium RIFCSPHIGHO2_02_FULL_37_9b]OGK42198.1 MAG: hypothetical protein A2954_04265 [Candidatus Roizmanbacteria bacterium RIFCSPLOWO2_01_FULL_37_12]